MAIYKEHHKDDQNVARSLEQKDIGEKHIQEISYQYHSDTKKPIGQKRFLNIIKAKEFIKKPPHKE